MQVAVRQIFLSDSNLSEYSDFSGAPSTCYNCHSYAWYNRSEDNNIWIDYPDVFIKEDKHCKQISRNELEKGDIVVCVDGNGYYSHSAVVENVDSDGTIECVSKCGNKGLFLHTLEYLDAMYLNIRKEYYRYTPGEHLIRYTTLSSYQHYVDCEASDCNYYVFHDTTIISVNANQHRLQCDDCDYFVYEDHDLYMYQDNVEDGCIVKCRGCAYTINCPEAPEYDPSGSLGHYISCPSGEFSIFEEHSGLSSQIAGNLYYHNGYCTVCNYSYTEAHTWQAVSGGYRCADCGMTASSVPGIMSLSDEELKALLAELSEDELAAFIAGLDPEARNRVTSVLTPPEDDFVTE